MLSFVRDCVRGYPRLKRWLLPTWQGLARLSPGADAILRAIDWYWRSRSFRLHPKLSASIPIARTGRVNGVLDSVFITRIRRAYHTAVSSIDLTQSTGGSWLDFAGRCAPVHEALISGSDRDVAELLSDPLSTSLLSGMYSWSLDNRIDPHPTARRIIAALEDRQLYESLVRLCEAIGAIRLWYPEGDGSARHGYRRSRHTEPPEELLAKLDQTLGLTVNFPNPFPGERGLLTSRGIASYRTFGAIYQAWRLRQLAQASDAGILEIGAGIGRTAYYARHLGLRRYTIVDLPLANVCQAVFLGHALGPGAIWLLGDDPSLRANRIAIESPAAFFASNDRYDVAINVDSMTEMTQSQAVVYLRAIATRSGRFVSINWESVFRVFDLPAIAGINVNIQRFPYWMRNGYVEELMSFGPIG